jgi:hypothetical protein
VDEVTGGEEVRVIDDVKVANLRAEKHVPPHVVTNASTSIEQEVIAAGIASVEDLATGGGGESIETSCLPANATHQIKASFLAQPGLVDAVKVENDGTIGLTEATEVSLAGSPCGVKAEADTPVKDDIGADIHIQAALFGANEI